MASSSTYFSASAHQTTGSVAVSARAVQHASRVLPDIDDMQDVIGQWWHKPVSLGKASPEGLTETCSVRSIPRQSGP